MTQQVKVTGADRVARTMHDLADDLADLSQPGAAAAEQVAAAAQGYAPRRTGRLRASIEAKATRDGATITAGVGIVRPYPAVQEYGSSRRGITATHYMRQAAESRERAAVSEYETAVARATDKIRGA